MSKRQVSLTEMSSYTHKKTAPKRHSLFYTIHLHHVFASAIYTIHSCMASSSIPVSFITAAIFSLSSSGAHQARPQPAEISLGTGMILPGVPRSLQTFSIAIASAVVWKVTTSFSSFFLMLLNHHFEVSVLLHCC